MKHENFRLLLAQAVVAHGSAALTQEERARPVRVQWDPERGPRLEVLPYRSIQIGIGQGLSRKWAEEWVESIEDVTDRALRLRDAVEKEGGVEIGELVERGCVPVERVYEVSEDLRGILGMDGCG